MSDTSQTVIGWVGAGKMGLPMLQHLLNAGYPAQAYDRDPARAQLAAQSSATVVQSPAEAVRNASFVFSSLPNDAAFLQAALASDGIVANCAKGSIYVDTSTISPEASATVAAAAELQGVRYLRSPVSGNNRVAEAGELTLMTSGPKDAYDATLPMLKLLGVRHFYLGQAEEARLMKLVINLMVSVTAGMMAEALTLGRSGGLDWEQMLDVMEASAVASPMVKIKLPPLRKRDFSATMSVIAQTKDVDLILDAGKANGVPLALTAALRQMFQALISQGGGEEDYIAVIKQVEHSAGIASEPYKAAA